MINKKEALINLKKSGGHNDIKGAKNFIRRYNKSSAKTEAIEKAKGGYKEGEREDVRKQSDKDTRKYLSKRLG